MALRTFVLAVLVLVAASGAALFWYHQPDAAMPAARTIAVASTTLSVDVADTESLREQGLSGRASLAEGSGMLFVFDQDGQWGIWMKDMRFSIDIVWIDAQGSVLTIAPAVSPGTYPKVFYPSAPARYVLELPAGWAAAHGIAEGSKVVL